MVHLSKLVNAMNNILVVYTDVMISFIFIYNLVVGILDN